MAVNERGIRTSGKEFMRKLCHFGHPNFIPFLGDAHGIAKSAWKIRGVSVASKLTLPILILAYVQQIFCRSGQFQWRVPLPAHRCDRRKERGQRLRRQGGRHDLDGASKSNNDSARHAWVVGERQLNLAITRAKREVIRQRAQFANSILR